MALPAAHSPELGREPCHHQIPGPAVVTFERNTGISLTFHKTRSWKIRLAKAHGNELCPAAHFPELSACHDRHLHLLVRNENRLVHTAIIPATGRLSEGWPNQG